MLFRTKMLLGDTKPRGKGWAAGKRATLADNSDHLTAP